MLLLSLKIAAAIVVIIALILLYLTIEYKCRYNGILKGYFHNSYVKIDNSFSCHYMPFVKCGIWFNEYPIDEFTYHLNITVNLPWLAFDYTSDFLK